MDKFSGVGEELLEIRVYEHPDVAAQLIGGDPHDACVAIHGWDVCVGDYFDIDGVLCEIVTVYSRIQTGDSHGNYRWIDARRV